MKGEKAVRMGIMDFAVHDSESVVESTVHLGDRLAERKWNGKVYAEIGRACIWRYVVCLDWFRKPL